VLAAPLPPSADSAPGGGAALRDAPSVSRLPDPLRTAAQLAGDGVAFVLMTVVRAVAPTSAKPGDKAILTERGDWLGWIGGSCAEPAARRAARQAFADGQSRLLHLTNDEAHLARPGVELAAMSCYSGGSLEIYVEPHLPQPSLVVFGRSPAAEALCQLGLAMGYRVSAVDLRPGAEALPASVRSLVDLAEPVPSATYVVVASHGHFEVEALEWALRREVAYVGLVSSRRRWPDVRERLERIGLGAQAARVHAPAGLELGAARPEEVALSVLSQIVAERRTERGARSAAGAAPAGLAAAAPPRLAADASGSQGESGAGCCSLESSASPGAETCCTVSSVPERAAEPRFAALVLAAGLSRRMGAPNKLLLELDGEPLIVRSVRTVLHTGFDQIVVVLGHQAEQVERVLQPLGVRCVLNPDFESGQVSSVRAGLAALAPALDAVMICLGDQPLLEVSDLGALKRAFRARPHGSIVVPTHQGSRGNPVALDWASAVETLQRGASYGCRHFLDEHPERVYSWPAPNEHFIRDVDLPGDYQALIDRASA
jgi:CTP:molybdopterin cytidylyltransferase MocA/xanthine/CO dehydrogenase XdhC/CoxF family maturation factor